MKTLVLAMSMWSIGLSGGVTSPHSDCNSGTCLDRGTTSQVTVERHWKFNENFSIRYGVAGSYMHFNKADRDSVDDPRRDKRSDSDMVINTTFKPTVTLGRYSVYPQAGIGIDTGGEAYSVIGGGLSARISKGWYADIQYQELKSKCTWHRTSTVGIRYEF